MNKRGQVSTEYLMITGILLFFLIFVLSFSLDRATTTLKINKITASLETIEAGIERVGFLGTYNREMVLVELPRGVNNISIDDREMTIKADTFGAETDFHFNAPQNINLTGSINNQPGRHYVRIEMVNSTHIKIIG